MGAIGFIGDIGFIPDMGFIGFIMDCLLNCKPFGKRGQHGFIFTAGRIA